jgi:LuxR family maltose regulon positive regulatory protein
MCLITFNEQQLFEKVCGEFINNIESNESLREEERNWLLGEFELLMSFTEYNDIVKMAERQKKACSLLKKPAIYIDTKGGWTFGSPSVLYMFYREAGQLLQNVQDLKDSMPYYYMLGNGHGMGAEYIMEAERHFNLGELENAEIIAHKALYMASENKQSEIVICALFVQARCALIKGDFSSILATLEKMHEHVNKERIYALRHTFEMCEAFIYAFLKEEQSVPEWVSAGNFHATRLYFQAGAFANIIYGRVLLIKGEYLKLLGIAEEFLGIASVSPNLLAIIYTTIYTAAANERIFRRNEALSTMKQALDMSMQDRIYMPFVENGDYIEPLLKELEREGSYKQEINVILKLYSDYQKAKRQIKEQYFVEKNLI